MMKQRIIKYSLPVRIVDSNIELSKLSLLLQERDDQISLCEPNLISLQKGDYFILDFGVEMCGGIRLIIGDNGEIRPNMKLHIRFGESVSEAYSTLGEKGACNDHSIRDFEVEVPSLSDQHFGDTGFRFVRIDVLESTPIAHPIKAVYAWQYDYQHKVINEYKSEDPRINEIYDTCVRTLTLCMQNRIWDGIKRDRLVWIGDMEPEVHALLHVYGNIPLLEETLLTAMRANPMPCWINGIPSYSVWFLLIMYDLFSIGHETNFIKNNQKYMDDIIELLNKCVIANDLDFDKVKLSYGMKNFIDWPSYKEDNEQERKDTNILLLKYVMPKVLEMYDSISLTNENLLNLLNKLETIYVAIPTTKVFAAFYQLVYKDEKSYKLLVEGNSKGMSTFMSYYVLKAIASKDKGKALEITKEYYGAMLDLGATTFFEDFNIDWAKDSCRIDEINNDNKKDLHGDHGEHCYLGFRHSLCHGWSVGPISFLIEEDIK